MFAAIETRFGGNKATKKTQKTLLKQQYENCSASSTESLDSIFNRLQKIVSRLTILGVVVSQEDLNSKFLSSLPPEWNTYIVVWMNKPEIETMSIDNLYNNFKIIEQKVKKSVGASSGAQNLAFMTAPSTSILPSTRSDAPSSGIPPPLPISVPTSSPPLLLPSASRREDIPEVTLPPQKRLGIALGPRYEVGESLSVAAARPTRGLRVDYGFIATMDREIRRDPKRETKARLSREAWRRSMDASNLTRGEVMSLRTTVLGQMSEIRELLAADRMRQAVTSEMLKADHRRSAEMRELSTTDHTREQQLIQTLTVMQSLQGQVTTLQGQVTALQGQVTALQGQQGPVGG
ncbi:hypothetical protein Tco_1560054, partial [Tanacetum coccineum]